MNLQLARKILGDAEAHSGVLKVCGREAAREVYQMVEAGLVRTARPPGADPSEAEITGITHAGHHFYRAFLNARSLVPR
jgi:hypothetical protein